MDISAANLNDDRMLQDMVDGITAVRQPVGRPRKRPAKLHGDKGCDYPECRELLRERTIVARIAREGIESSKRLGWHRYVGLFRRWRRDGTWGIILAACEPARTLRAASPVTSASTR